MKFRFSNEHNFAVEFEANNPQELAESSLNALIEFRAKTVKKYHDGSDHKNKSWYPEAFFHLNTGPNQWCIVGEMKDGIYIPRYFAIIPRLVVEGDPVSEPTDSQICRANASKWWGMAITTINWSHQITGFVADVSDAIGGQSNA